MPMVCKNRHGPPASNPAAPSFSVISRKNQEYIAPGSSLSGINSLDKGANYLPVVQFAGERPRASRPACLGNGWAVSPPGSGHV